MPLLIERRFGGTDPVMKQPDGVAFAEVSPDICFCVNTRRHRGVVSVAAGGVRHCNAGGLYAGSVGMGTAAVLPLVRSEYGWRCYVGYCWR